MRDHKAYFLLAQNQLAKSSKFYPYFVTHVNYEEFDEVLGFRRGLAPEIQEDRERKELLFSIQGGYYESACQVLSQVSSSSLLFEEVQTKLVTGLTQNLYNSLVKQASEYVDFVASDSKADYIVLEIGSEGGVVHLWPEGLTYSKPEEASWNSRSVCGERVKQMYRSQRGVWLTHPQNRVCHKCALEASQFLETQERKGHSVFPAHQDAEFRSLLTNEINTQLQCMVKGQLVDSHNLSVMGYSAFESVLHDMTYKRLLEGGEPLLQRILYIGVGTVTVPEGSLKYLSKDDWRKLTASLWGTPHLLPLRNHYVEKLSEFFKAKQTGPKLPPAPRFPLRTPTRWLLS